jgi:hypothetical protein
MTLLPVNRRRKVDQYRQTGNLKQPPLRADLWHGPHMLLALRCEPPAAGSADHQFAPEQEGLDVVFQRCLLYTSPSPRD